MDNTYNIDFIARCIAGHNKADIKSIITELENVQKQIETNKNNILSEQAKTKGMTEGGTDYITVNGIRVYVSATQPTGARTGDLWIGG